MGFESGGGIDPDNITLEQNISGKLQIKDDGVTAAKVNVIGIDGTTGKVNPINSTNFEDLSGNNLTGSPVLSGTNFTDIKTAIVSANGTYATETINATENYTTAKSFTLTPPSQNSMLLGVKITAETKATDSSCCFRGVATHVGAAYSVHPSSSSQERCEESAAYVSNTIFWCPQSSCAGGIGSSGDASMFGTISASQMAHGTTYTLIIQFKRVGGSGNVYIQNIDVTVYWLNIANCSVGGTVA